MENEKNGLNEILELIQEAESRSFYAFADETNKFRKGRRKVVNSKIRDALEELARVIEKENEENA